MSVVKIQKPEEGTLIVVTAKPETQGQVIGLSISGDFAKDPKSTIMVLENIGKITFPILIELYIGDKPKELCGEFDTPIELHERFVINKLDDFPDESVPCPCGDPKHWLVKIDKS